MKENKGITLIALVITIIILLILAGVTIAQLTENGLFEKAKIAKEQEEKTQIKEKIELAITEIQIEEISKGNDVTIKSLAQGQLTNKIQDIQVTLESDKIIGEYNGYEYTINEKLEVIIGNKISKDKIEVKYTLSTEEIGATEVIISVKATVNNDTITKIIKPDLTEENKNEVTYTVTKNGEYIFTVESKAGKVEDCKVKISNLIPAEPIIQSINGYAILKSTGIVKDDLKVSIDFEENENLEHCYSEDNGSTWEKYEGEFIPTATTIKAKSYYKENPEIFVEVEKNIVLEDAIGPEAYDDDTSTGVYGLNADVWSKYKYLEVSEEMVGKELELYFGNIAGAYCYSRIDFLDKEGNILKSSDTVNGGIITIQIPDKTERLAHVGQYNALLYEIKIIYSIDIEVEKIQIQKLTKQGIVDADDENIIRIDYDEIFTQKFYKIGEDSEWQEYNNPISVNLGDIIYAKGVDETGEKIAENKLTMPSYNTYKLSDEAYDNDTTTYMQGTDKSIYLYIDEEIRMSQVYLKVGSWSGSYCYLGIYKISDDSTIIETKSYDQTFLMPDEAIVKIFCQVNAGIYEIQPESE